MEGFFLKLLVLILFGNIAAAELGIDFRLSYIRPLDDREFIG